ncbi:MAG TPA: M56 family metallopeptidase, partial [Polyangiaceae bacterium]|nr:M56 family metallopeptidase [Polyangiaceae bacterium]
MSDLAIGFRVFAGQVESLGHALVGRVLPLEMWTAALLLGALAVDRALARRARASFRIALYAPVALRVVLPLDWRIPIAHAPSVVTYLAPLARIGGGPVAEPPTWQPASWYTVAAVAYVVVAALLAGRAVVGRLRLGRALAAARPVAARRLGVPFDVLEHDDLGPMVVGLLSPRIVIPRRLFQPGEEHSLACVLRHEGAHVRRRDAWLTAAMQLLAVVAWPVLPVWPAMARVRQLVELACDEAALTGADVTERRRYGHALLDMAEWRALTVVPTGAGELHFGSTLRTRIEALASQRHWPLAAQALTFVFAPVALLVACSGASAPAPSAAATSTVGATPQVEEDTGYGYMFEEDSAKAKGDPAGAAHAPLNADGRVAPEAIQTLVRGRYGAIATCYAAGRRKNPQLAGTVVVKLVFGKDGTATSSNPVEGSSTLPDADVAACVAGELGKVTLPAGPGVLTVVYPIQ